MKRYLSILLAFALILGTGGCGQKELPPTIKEESIPEDMYSMTEPIDALMRCMIENQVAYNPNDPVFFWTSLSYFLGGYALDHPLAQTTEEEQLKVPRKLAQEFAIALFSDYEDLPTVPESLGERITYDENEDAYFIALGDIGLSETVLSNMTQTATGYALTAQLRATTEEKALIGQWSVDLVKNEFSDSIENPAYLYSVAGVTEEINNALFSATASAVFNGLSDGHTAEVTLEDGTIGAFQFYDPTVLKKLDTLKAGDVLSFSYTKDNATGVMTIIEIK